MEGTQSLCLSPTSLRNGRSSRSSRRTLRSCKSRRARLASRPGVRVRAVTAERCEERFPCAEPGCSMRQVSKCMASHLCYSPPTRYESRKALKMRATTSKLRAILEGSRIQAQVANRFCTMYSMAVFAHFAYSVPRMETLLATCHASTGRSTDPMLPAAESVAGCVVHTFTLWGFPGMRIWWLDQLFCI